MRPVSTFSIVAHDARTESWGVAVESRFLACGSIVTWARAAAGGIPTEAFANGRHGPAGLALLERGLDAQAVVDALLADDDAPELRQLGVVDRAGAAAAFTGAQCVPWAGHVVRAGFCCQGNMLAGPEVLSAMARAFER